MVPGDHVGCLTTGVKILLTKRSNFYGKAPAKQRQTGHLQYRDHETGFKSYNNKICE